MRLNLIVALSTVSAMLMPGMESDLYEGACNGFLAAYYAFGNASCKSMDTWMWGSCMCPDTKFAQSVLHCIGQMIDEVSPVPSSEKNATKQESYQAFIGDCPQYTMNNVTDLLANSTNLKPYDESLKKGANYTEWPVEAPFALSKQDLIDAYNAQRTSSSSENLNKRYGSALIGYWAGIILLKSLWHIITEVFPLGAIKIGRSAFPKWIRRDLVIHTNKNLNNMGVTKPQLAIVVGFWILMLIVTYAGLPTYWPNFNYMDKKSRMWGTVIGDRSGVICMYIIPLLPLFAGRNNILMYFTGWSLNTFLLFHKWVARAVVLLVMVHTIAYSIQRASNGRYSGMFSEAYWNWGIFGTAASCFLLVQGFRYIRRMAYDLFLVLHILGSIFFFVGGYWHLKLLDEIYGLYFYWATFAVWGLDRALRLLKVISSGIAEPGEVRVFGNVLTVTARNPPHWQLFTYPGKYMFIHFWHPSLVWQSHPFSVYVNPLNPKELKIACKVHKGATKEIADLTMRQGVSLNIVDEKGVERVSNQGMEHTMSVLMDGPYGHTFDLVEFDEVVFIAGGTGITALFSYIQAYLIKYPESQQKYKLFWATRDEENARLWFRDELMFLQENSHRVTFQIFSPTSTKLSIPDVVEASVSSAMGPLAFMCCGPSSMCLSTRESVAASMSTTDNYIEYFEELFNW